MSEIDLKKIYEIALKHYNQAKNSIPRVRAVNEMFHSAISDSIPGYEAEKLRFGSYDKENFAVMFVDMRESTLRAERVGPEKTFLTMHVYLTALLEVVKHYKGRVIDIMGDGLMVFWGGKEAREKEGITRTVAAKNAGLCGLKMLIVREKVINKIIEDESLGTPINIGVGVTFDSVIVTKIGINDTYDVKAFGNCINKASKYSSSVSNQVKVSKKIHELWPKSKGGTIRFIPSDGGYILQ